MAISWCQATNLLFQPPVEDQQRLQVVEWLKSQNLPMMNDRYFMAHQKVFVVLLLTHEKLSTTEPMVDARMKNELTAIKTPMRTVGLTSLTASSLRAWVLALATLSSIQVIWTALSLRDKIHEHSGHQPRHPKNIAAVKIDRAERSIRDRSMLDRVNCFIKQQYQNCLLNILTG